MEYFVDFLLGISNNLGYPGIILLMTIESSFIPFPSEIVIPPAAYLASQGVFNIYLVIFFGVLGSLLGAFINYYLALSLGRKLVYALVDKKIFKFLLLNQTKLKKAEEYFLKYGNISTFIGRFIPAIRQLISLPAGFSKMNLKHFVFCTSLGSGIWVIILAIIGYSFGANQDIILKYFKYYKDIFYLLIFLVIVILVFIYLRNRKKSKVV